MAPLRHNTGPMQFGDDWTGVFIRGDEALALAASIRQAQTLQIALPTNEGSLLDGIARTLETCCHG